MQHIWAPWRIQYIQMKKPRGCILCQKPAEDRDLPNYILHRARLNFIMLNLYPYTPGHLMVAPFRHVPDLDAMTEDERNEHIGLVTVGTRLLKDALHPDGFNIGMNLGKVAGAGVADHIHTHIVPRWNGDTNFMTVLGDIRVVNEALADTYGKLKATLGEILR